MKPCKFFGKVLGVACVFLGPFCCQAVASQPNSLGTASNTVGVEMKDGQHLSIAEQCTHGRPKMKEVTKLSLDSIRTTLIRLEETIVFALIERAQYRRNLEAYKKDRNLGIPIGANAIAGPCDLSLLEYYLVGTELLDHVAKRYESEEENAFFPERLPHAENTCTRGLESGKYLSAVGDAASVNFNHVLLEKYITDIVPAIAMAGQDENLAPSVSSDIVAQQALSKRVHYGKFVAEAKYLADPQGYQKLVDANDIDGVMELLTNKAVEKKVLERVKLKAAAYGTGPIGENADCKVDPEQIESMYRDIVIPITKEIEVDYLFRRCGKPSPYGY